MQTFEAQEANGVDNAETFPTFTGFRLPQASFRSAKEALRFTLNLLNKAVVKVESLMRDHEELEYLRGVVRCSAAPD